MIEIPFVIAELVVSLQKACPNCKSPGQTVEHGIEAKGSSCPLHKRVIENAIKAMQDLANVGS